AASTSSSRRGRRSSCTMATNSRWAIGTRSPTTKRPEPRGAQMINIINAARAGFAWLVNSHPVAQLSKVRVIAFVILAVSVVALEGNYWEMHSVIHTMGEDAAPSVVAFHEIKNSAIRLAADLDNELDAPPGQNYASQVDYRAVATALQKARVDAHKNI